jgi:Fibronectin type III-like domain
MATSTFRSVFTMDTTGKLGQGDKKLLSYSVRLLKTTFRHLFLSAGQSKRVTLELDQRSFAFFDATKHLWVAEPGVYNVLVGASSQDIRLSGQFALSSEIDSKP